MKVFLSHSSQTKPLIRELRGYLPEHINAWIDEKRLLIGDPLAETLQEAIETDSDFLILFIDRHSAESEWVKKEIEWALSMERRLGKTFVLPVVLDHSAWVAFEPADLRKRKCLTCLDFTGEAIHDLATNLTSQLFAWATRARGVGGRDDRNVLEEADRFYRSFADEIRTVVYSHRESNPLAIEKLYERLRPLGTMTGNTLEDFISLLHRLRNQRLLAGLYFDEDEIFMKEEEHFSWKVKTFVDAKRRIARRALQEIHSGDLIALDGGSTTNEIAKHLGRSLRLHRLTQLRVVTNSLPAAHELLSLASEMGLEDKSEVLQVFIAGGRVRSNTLAVVGLGNEAEENVYNLLSKLGGASICFIGANGIFDGGFTTRTLEEAQTKKAILSSSKRRVIVTDASKFGLRQEQIFADFDNGIEIITVRDGFERALEQYEALLASRNTAFTYA